MSSCIQTSGQGIATSRVGTVLLAPVAVTADATGLSAAAATTVATAALVGGFGFGRDEKAMAAPQIHNYSNRPGSPPRGRHR